MSEFFISQMKCSLAAVSYFWYYLQERQAYGCMRVVAGTAGGLKLITRDSEDTKPTLDRVKEAMFSMLSPYLNGATVLDLFSGSGALGIEALSRGAARCVFCDKSKACCDIIEKNLESTGLADKATVLRGDFTGILKTLKMQGEIFDMVLLDPPYNRGFEREAMLLLARYCLCSPEAIVLCEHAFQDKMPEQCGEFSLMKDKKYGTVGVSVYEKKV